MGKGNQADPIAAGDLAAAFAAQAARSPDVIALVSGTRQVSYAELAGLASRVTGALLAQGVTAEQPVGLLIDRSIEAVIALLGITGAGAAYVPLPLDYPDQRLAAMARTAGVSVAIGTRQARTRSVPVRLLALDALLGHKPAADGAVPATGPLGLCYIMFTSCSTGEPKGCAITHGAVARLAAAPEVAELSGADTVFAHSPLGFDASTFEIWCALLAGARLHVLPSRALPGREFVAALTDSGATVAWMTAALFQECAEYGFDENRTLRRLIVGGDVLPVDAVNKALARWPRIQLVNGYGPTENTVFTCCHPVGGPADPVDGVPIGKPISGTGAVSLTGLLEPAPPGVTGELYAYGAGLARGYIGDPRATAASFLPNPFAAEPGGRMYRTGDRVLAGPDGVLAFRGRQDRQVKVRGGFRVELDEIERLLRDHPLVADASVTAVRGEDGGHLEHRLVAAVVPAAQAARLSAELRAALRARVPEYMVPNLIRILPKLPLNAHGKLDRGALKEVAERQATQSEFVEPGNDIEAGIRDIWENLLGVAPVGVLDEFFDAGGDSLLATRLAERLKTSYDFDLSAQSFYAAPTVRAVAKSVQESLRGRPEHEYAADADC
jgi:amino acid adenylation domain-containing protein